MAETPAAEMAEDKTEKKIEQKLGDIQRIDISPNLVKAYLINLGKTILLLGALVGSFYLVQYLAGENPLASIFEAIGVPIIWVTRVAMILAGLLLILTIFNTLSLTSYDLFFEGSRLTYSYGAFFKTTDSTEIANTIRVNYKEYRPFKLGDLVVGFTDTEKKDLRVPFIDDAKQQCDLVNKLIHFKQAQEAQEMLEKGAQ